MWTLRALGSGLTLSPGLTLRPGLTLSSGLALRTGHALDALRPLRSGWSLRAGLALGTGVSAARGECQRHANGKYRKNPHANPPVHIRPLMVAIFHHYAFNHARAPEFIAGTKVAAAEVSRRPIGEGFGYQRAFGYSWKDPDERKRLRPFASIGPVSVRPLSSSFIRRRW